VSTHVTAGGRDRSNHFGLAATVALVVVPVVVLVSVLAGIRVGTHGVLQASGAGAHRAQATAPAHHATSSAPRAAPGPGASTGAPSPASPSRAMAMGVYAGSGNVAGATSFQSALGAPVHYALDYFSGSSWSSISSPTWVLDQWQGSPYQLVFGVPMLPSGATLAAGAAGTYDAEFSTLAQNLVASGFANAWLVLGFDPTVAGTPWSVSTPTEAAQYVAYWRRIVAAMRAVPGASFRFVWDVTPPGNGLTPQDLYPGSSYVDVIATDFFDLGTGVPGAARFSTLVAAPYGPQWFSTFAAAEEKPFILAKWGVTASSTWGGGGDDPAFVHALVTWAEQSGVQLLMTWDAGTWAISGGGFPDSMAALRAAVDGRVGATG